jgi:AbiV family abortive infection protein
MTKQKLQQYCGKLDPSQIATGINEAHRNAQRLAADARMLLDAKRFPTATSLAILAIEEAGKSSILRQMSTASDDEIRSLWKEYRTHTKKNIMWIFPEFVAKGARHLTDFSALFDDSSEHPYLIENIKQLGFYTDCLGAAHWASPAEVLDEKLTNSLVGIAEILTKQTREVTTREIELWIDFMLPVKGKDLFKQKVALRDWYAALQLEGLAPAGDNEMEGFVFGNEKLKTL